MSILLTTSTQRSGTKTTRTLGYSKEMLRDEVSSSGLIGDEGRLGLPLPGLLQWWRLLPSASCKVQLLLPKATCHWNNEIHVRKKSNKNFKSLTLPLGKKSQIFCKFQLAEPWVMITSCQQTTDADAWSVFKHPSPFSLSSILFCVFCCC